MTYKRDPVTPVRSKRTGYWAMGNKQRKLRNKWADHQYVTNVTQIALYLPFVLQLIILPSGKLT